MTTYACYIVTSFWAYGELLMAIDLAERQRAAGIEPVLIIPPSHVTMADAKGMRYETLIPGSRKLNVMLLHDVQRRFRPSAVILADALNYSFCERHYGLRLEDLDVFKAAGGFARPLVKDAKGVAVTDGRLNIEFVANVQNPEINGIEVLAE